MADLPIGALGPFLSTLRTLPVWLLAGLALVGYALLFLPSFGGVEIDALRKEWGILFWIEAVAFSILALTRSVDAIVRAYQAHRLRTDERPALRLVPRLRQCWWHLAKQKDGSFITQISLDVEATNLTDHPVRIIKARIIRPKPKIFLVHGDVMLPSKGSPYHSEKHAVPPRDTATASIHLMVRGMLATRGKTLRATIGITDQFGHEYRLKRVVIPTHDPQPPKPSLKERIKTLLGSIRPFKKSHRDIEAAMPLPSEWQHGGKFDAVDLVLNEEKRSYAANNRERGGLGSLNVTLQSEPNYGWTEVGKIPELLWPKDKAKTISSPNLERLLKLHQSLPLSEKEMLERYLTSHLHRKSPFANVGYFVAREERHFQANLS